MAYTATVMPVNTLLSDGGSARLSMPLVWAPAAARWLRCAGLSVALGGLAGRGLARQYKGTFPVPLPAPWALRASLLGAAASAWLALIAVGAAGLVPGFARVPRLFATTAGAIAGTELVLFVIAAGLLRLRRPGLAALPLLGGGGGEGVRAPPGSHLPG